MKTMKLRWKMMVGLCGLLLGGLAGGVWAGECTYGTTAGDGAESVFTFTVPSTISLTGTEAPGTVLWRSTDNTGTKRVSTSCPGGVGSSGLIDMWGGSSSTLVGGFNVLPTNVAGIGYSIQNLGQGTSTGIAGYPNQSAGTNPSFLATATARLLFIKTSTAYFSGTSAATNVSGDFATWFIGTNKLRFANFRVSNTTTFTKPSGGGGGGGGGTIDPNPPATTCSFSTSPVNLGETQGGSLVNIGDKGRVASVPISLSCPANTRTASISFAAVTETTTADGVFTLNAGATARGVGIILMRSDNVTAVRFGQQFRVPLQSDSLGKFGSIGFSAATIKIGNPVGPGTVRGVLTVTLSVT